MIGLFCGEMGRSILEYNELTLKEYFIIVKAYRKKEYERYKEEWERIRWSAWRQPWQLKKNHQLKLTDLIKFPWEEKETEVITQEKVDAMLERINKRDKTNHKITMTDG